MAKQRPAQGSVEYLVVLAVVVIVALSLVGVLSGFPTLAQGVSEKESLAYWQGADVGLERRPTSAPFPARA